MVELDLVLPEVGLIRGPIDGIQQGAQPLLQARRVPLLCGVQHSQGARGRAATGKDVEDEPHVEEELEETKGDPPPPPPDDSSSESSGDSHSTVSTSDLESNTDSDADAQPIKLK